MRALYALSFLFALASCASGDAGLVRALEGEYSGREIITVRALDDIEIRHEYDIEVIGEARGGGLSEPRLYAWVERYDRDGQTLLDVALVRFMLVGGNIPLVEGHYPRDSLWSSALPSLPGDVEAFVRRKLSEEE